MHLLVIQFFVIFLIVKISLSSSVLNATENCVTPTGVSGECQYFRLCKSLFTLLQKEPLTKNDRTHLKRSVCGYKNKEPLLCCPDNFMTERPPVTATPNESNEGCVTPSGAQGLCQYLRSCDSLFKLLQTNPLTSSDKTYLSISQCGYKNNQPLVCCPDNFMTANMQSAMLLPKPGECGRDTTERIVGGTKTAIDEYPWMALLEYFEPNNITPHLNCSSVLINQRYVVTASHCVNGKQIPPTWTLSSVRLGEWNKDTDPDCEKAAYGPPHCADSAVHILIEEKIPHDKYNPNSINQHDDIALLRLASNVQYSFYIKPICLPRSDNLKTFNYDGISLQTAGWGRTEKTPQSNIKLKVNVDGVNIDTCNKKFMYSSLCNSLFICQSPTIRTSQICAGGEIGKDACIGDSGGPLMMLDQNVTRPYWYLVGIVSYGIKPCGLQGWPGVYTRISSYVDWIESKIRA